MNKNVISRSIKYVITFHNTDIITITIFFFLTERNICYYYHYKNNMMIKLIKVKLKLKKIHKGFAY